MAWILIAGKDWTARALLRAQLIEDGYDVEAYVSAADAVQRLWASRAMPALLIMDFLGTENPREEVATLSQWTKLFPIWILAGHGTSSAKEFEGRGFEKILFRPLDLGKLVQEIKERLAG